MDRPEPGLVKWSPNSSIDSFLHVNLQNRTVHLYEPSGRATNKRFDYDRISLHDDLPAPTTYDWSPSIPGIIAVGTENGPVNILKIDNNSSAFIELGVRLTRTCQAVAFNTSGLLAVGLDRVRLDQSLHIWDINRLPPMEKSLGTRVPWELPSDMRNLFEPRQSLESSVSISSIKFFEDNPNTLVVGLRHQGLRLHDLRDPHPAALFQTKCNNNLAIDYSDQNYFASSALDRPSVMVWDRRAASRPVASQTYVQATEDGDVPWGSTLRLDKSIDIDSDPLIVDGKHSLIRSLRYSRDHRGLLAVLSRAGQLRVLETLKEETSSNTEPTASPELLRVKTSHEMDPSYVEVANKNSRIVSCDWATLHSTALRPRMLVLRANGDIDILERPSNTSDHVFKMVPWQAPHRGLEQGLPYLDLMSFDPPQASKMLGPLLSERALSEVPIFGPKKADLRTTIKAAVEPAAASEFKTEMINTTDKPLPESFYKDKSIAGKLGALRTFVHEQLEHSNLAIDPYINPSTLDILRDGRGDMSLASNSLGSCRAIHEAHLSMLQGVPGLPRDALNVINHAMLLRARERYLFDAPTNRKVLADDPWTRFVWDWIGDAELAADDGGMVMGNMDLSYLGIYSIWMNDLGRNPTSRLSGRTTIPDTPQWEKAIGDHGKGRYTAKFPGGHSRRPYHRQLCLDMCAWGDSLTHSDHREDVDVDQAAPSYHTMMASRALFRGDTKQAVQILKKASKAHPELLFVSMALQLVNRGDKRMAKEQLDFDNAVASRTDPYLQAISSLIATGGWKAIANQRSLPLSDRVLVVVRNFTDDQLTQWLEEQVSQAVIEGDIEAIILTGISDTLVDIFAKHVEKFNDFQTAAIVLSICAPRFIDDVRCRAWRNAYRAHLQRHKVFFHRTKFEAESTRRSKRDGVPTIKPPSRQIALRCVYCDAETSLAHHQQQQQQQQGGTPVRPPVSQIESRNPLLATSINAGVSCPNCGRHLPRCVVCLEVVGVPRSDRPDEREESKMAGRFPTFCLRCDHVLHLDHARQWFARHSECPVPECRCRCNFRANPELDYH